MKRLWNLLRGFLRLFVSNVEQENPEIAYDNSIEDVTKKFIKLRGAAAAITRRANDLESEYKDKTTILSRMDAQLLAAAQMENPDLEVAAHLQAERDNLAQALLNMKEDWDQAELDEADVRQALLDVQSQIKQLKAEKEVQIGRLKSSEARIAIQEQLDGISVSAEIKALDNVRSHIKNRVAEAKLVKDMNANSLDSRLKKFEQATTNAGAKERFMKFREQQLAKAQGTPKTL